MNRTTAIEQVVTAMDTLATGLSVLIAINKDTLTRQLNPDAALVENRRKEALLDAEYHIRSIRERLGKAGITLWQNTGGKSDEDQDA